MAEEVKVSNLMTVKKSPVQRLIEDFQVIFDC